MISLILFIPFYIIVFLALYWLDLSINLLFSNLDNIYNLVLLILWVLFFYIDRKTVIKWFDKNTKLYEFYKRLINKNTENSNKLSIILKNRHNTYVTILGYTLIYWVINTIFFWIQNIFIKDLLLALYFSILLFIFLSHQLTVDFVEYKYKQEEKN